MRRKLRFSIVFLCWFGALALPALAQSPSQSPPNIETQLIAEVRMNVSNSTGQATARYLPATILRQGETVYYTLRIRNMTEQYARDVIVTQRVPANTRYVEDSAAGPGADVQFSVDGGQSFADAEQLHSVDANGVEQPASPEQYTHIQWRMRNALAPGAVALARFRAVFQ